MSHTGQLEKWYLNKVLQNPEEHNAFLALLQQERVKSYLEIGSMYGGSLWRTAHILPVGARVVSVDYAIDHSNSLPYLKDAIADLKADGYDAHLFHADSRDPATVKAVSELGPFDCVFIDGSHLEESVQADWENYGPMARIVAFHDIAWNSTWKSAKPVTKPLFVPLVWNRVKHGYRHREIKLHHPSNYYGIGVLWRDDNHDPQWTTSDQCS